jgi:hypothetical protein
MDTTEISMNLLKWVCLVFIWSPSLAQGYFDTTLKPGPYVVGFKAGIHYDLGRPPLAEQFARYRHGRAVHLSVWYPAKIKSNHPPMRFMEYIDEVSRMINPKEVTKRTRKESIDAMTTLVSQLGGDSTLLLKHLGSLLNSTTHAYRNAAHVGGDFPILIYPESPHLNSILSEYLASHGFIVVSVSRHGTLTKDFEWKSVRGIETLVQDCQFALSVVKREFDTDDQRMAVIGTGMNASAGLAWAMRSPEIDAVVSLEGGILTSYEYNLLKTSPYFDTMRVTSPMLVIYSPHEVVDARLIGHYPFADRHMLYLPQMTEFRYLNFGVWEKRIEGILLYAPGDTCTGFEWMARYTLYFLDWQLRQGYHGKEFFDNSPAQHGLSPGEAEYSHLPGDSTHGL